MNIQQKNFFEQARINMVNCQIAVNQVSDTNILKVLKTIPREDFLPVALQAKAYLDISLEIAPKRFMLEPRVFGKILQLMDLAAQPSASILVIAGGTGYEAAVLSQLNTNVTALDCETHFVNMLQTNLKDFSCSVLPTCPLFENKALTQKWDYIFINGSVTLLPQSLTKALTASSGRIFALVQQGPYIATAVEAAQEADGRVTISPLFDCTSSAVLSINPQV